MDVVDKIAAVPTTSQGSFQDVPQTPIVIRERAGGGAMMPIGPLMIEHRLIERVIADIRLRLEARGGPPALDPDYIDRCVDFIHTYADRCHHGKEEEILFRELASRPLEPELAALMQDLLEDHRRTRALTARVVQANARYRGGDAHALTDVELALAELINIYPAHIEQEDKHFFKPCMAVFSEEERQAMLREFEAFDRTLIHEKYRQLVEDLEAGRA